MAFSVVARGKSRPAVWRSMEQVRKDVSPNGDSLFLGQTARALPGLPQPVWLNAVADGLGGEGNDDFASQTVVGSLGRTFSSDVQLCEPLTGPDAWLRAAVAQANVTLCEARMARRLSGAYTTLTAALIAPDAEGHPSLYLANVGDSRLYLLQDAELRQLTRDDGESGFISRVVGDPELFLHPWLAYATTLPRTQEVDSHLLQSLSGALERLLADLPQIDASVMARLFLYIMQGILPLELAPVTSRPLGSLLDATGMERFTRITQEISTLFMREASRLAPVPLQDGDRLLLCSDGISNAFDEDFLEETLSTRLNGRTTAESLDAVLLTLLEAPGRVDDDRTAVLIEVG